MKTVYRSINYFIAAVWLINGLYCKLLGYVITPDLLLWGHYNSLFAFLFIVLIYTNEFLIPQKTVKI